MEQPGPDDIRFISLPLLRLRRLATDARQTFRPPDALLLRSAVAVGFLLAFFLAVLARVAQLQLVKRAELEAIEDRVHQPFRRPAGPPGDILDAYGRVMATSEPAWAVKVDPIGFRRELSDPARRRKAIKLLAEALGKSPAQVEAVINQQRTWAYLARRVDGRVRDRVKKVARDNEIPYITFDREYQRVYVLNATACHLIGWRGPDQAARIGLEAVYDFVLTGQPGSARGATDRFGRKIPWPDRGRPYPGRAGRSLVTTIDLDIQHAMETALDDVVARWRPNLAMGIVMKPRTGEILAMAARPNYDPNGLCKIGPDRTRATRLHTINPITQVGFEPGSCAKPFVVAAALEDGLTSESERFFCDGLLTGVGGPPIHCAHGARHGWLTLDGVVARSCNVSAARLALRLGSDRLLEWLRRFGFGRPTGIELPEGLGLLPPAPGHSRVYPRDVACLGFGQGMSVTLIQLAAAYCALVNDGVYMLPFVVRRVITHDGRVFRQVEPVAVRRVCSPETSRRVRAMLKSVVERGTGKAARIEAVAVGGKTGTADRPKPGGGFQGYIASFVMVLPIDNPQYVIAIVVDNPHGAHYGGVVAAPAARSVALAILRVHRQLAAVSAYTSPASQAGSAAP